MPWMHVQWKVIKSDSLDTCLLISILYCMLYSLRGYECHINNKHNELSLLKFINDLWIFLTLYSCNSWSPWWRHQMETFSALLALCAGNSPVPVNSPHKGQWRGALMFSFICVWINDWVNNRVAGDLKRHRGHYDVNVMHYARIKQHGDCAHVSYCSSQSKCNELLSMFRSQQQLCGSQGVVSLTVRELSKIISRKYTVP